MLALAGREAIVSIIEDVAALIASSEKAQDSYRESDRRVAQVEREMRAGYVAAREALRELLRSELKVDVDCVDDLS